MAIMIPGSPWFRREACDWIADSVDAMTLIQSWGVTSGGLRGYEVVEVIDAHYPGGRWAFCREMQVSS